jgi:aldehyde:ferredoxin oxidoreductase
VRPVAKEVERFRNMHAWVSRILRIDLSTMHIEAQEAEPCVPEYLGARGIAARICWQAGFEPGSRR